MTDDEIEKAAEAFADGHTCAPLFIFDELSGDPRRVDKYCESLAKKSFIAGARWMAEQMHHEKIDQYVEGINDGVEFEREEKAKREAHDGKGEKNFKENVDEKSNI